MDKHTVKARSSEGSRIAPFYTKLDPSHPARYTQKQNKWKMFSGSALVTVRRRVNAISTPSQSCVLQWTLGVENTVSKYSAL